MNRTERWRRYRVDEHPLMPIPNQGWRTYGKGELQATPVEHTPEMDLLAHADGEGCWCRPYWHCNQLFHHALDGRLAREHLGSA